MKKDEVKLMYQRNGLEEEVFLSLNEQNINAILDSVRKLFNLGCKWVSVETKELSLHFDSRPDLNGKQIEGRFKQYFKIVK